MCSAEIDKDCGKHKVLSRGLLGSSLRLEDNSRRRRSDPDPSGSESRHDETKVFRVLRDLLGWDNPDTPQFPLTDK